MADIWGTPKRDQLYGTDENDLIRGGRGEDYVYGGLGDDILYGGWGNDTITDWDGRSEIYGGRGSDRIEFTRGHAWGGWGNDTISVYGGGWAIGGMGNDTLSGSGALWGDQGPDTSPEQWVAGNDTLNIWADADSAIGYGGLGRDKFTVIINGDGNVPQVGIVADFQPGVDKIRVEGWFNDGDPPFDAFRDFDSNGNGILEATDERAHTKVWVDEFSQTMRLDFGASTVIVHGTTQLSYATDWVMA